MTEKKLLTFLWFPFCPCWSSIPQTHVKKHMQIWTLQLRLYLECIQMLALSFILQQVRAQLMVPTWHYGQVIKSPVRNTSQVICFLNFWVHDRQYLSLTVRRKKPLKAFILAPAPGTTLKKADMRVHICIWSGFWFSFLFYSEKQKLKISYKKLASILHSLRYISHIMLLQMKI